MSYKIEIAQAAEKDIWDAFLWYENQKKNLGSLFEENIYKAFDNIQNNPLKFQIRYGNYQGLRHEKISLWHSFST